MAQFHTYTPGTPTSEDKLLFSDTGSGNAVKTVNPNGLPVFGDNVVVVTSTIQAAIDALPAMQGDPVSGITNPYIVYVPPGHETETYDWGAKKNIRVIFMDNPENKFIVDQFASCDTLDGWAGIWGSTLSLDADHRTSGINCFKCEIVDSNAVLQTTGSFDLRKYQGVLIDVEFNTEQIGGMRIYLYSGTDFFMLSGYPLTTGVHRGSMFFTITPESAKSLDLSAIDTVRIWFQKNSGYSGTVTGYIDNIRFVRTTPHKTAIFRFDDGWDDGWEVVSNRLEAYGWRGNFSVIGEIIDTPGRMTTQNCIDMYKNGHSFLNHSLTADMYDTLTRDETYQYFMNNFAWLEDRGLMRGRGIFVNPGDRANEYLQDIMEENHIISAYPTKGIMPTLIEGINPPFNISSELQNFIDYSNGGIVQFVGHYAPDNTDFATFLAWVNSNFSEVIMLHDCLERYPEHVYQKAQQAILKKTGWKETLTATFGLHQFKGDSFFLDPGGANRNVVPVGKFKPFCEKRIINTADADETLTFDPLFTSSGVHDGADNADMLTDSGESWIAGQLVGRTINNTTDGSSGVITANTATTITAELSGGTDNDWDIGDTYTITPVGSNQDIPQGGMGVFIYDGEGWH